MRKLNSASKTMYQAPVGVHFLIFLLATSAITFSGCSQLQQQTSFKPIQQRRSVTEDEKRSVDEILKRQDEIRLAAEQAAAEAEAAAAAEAAQAETTVEEVSNDAPPEVSYQYIDVQPVESTGVTIDPDFSIAQVSFETEVEEPADPGTPSEPSVEPTIETTEFDGFSEFVAEPARDVAAMDDISSKAMEAVEAVTDFEIPTPTVEFETAENVRLMANADDLEGVPFNIARDDIDLSQANFLRPSSDPELSQVSPSEIDTAIVTEVVNNDIQEPFGDIDARQLPLQPMLFNPSTRATKTTVEGTLRPMNTSPQELEPKVEVQRTVENVTAPMDYDQSFGPLLPLGNPGTIKLTSRGVETSNNTLAGSRLLQPIDRTVEEAPTFLVPKTEVIPVKPEIAEFAPVMVSEEIIVVDPVPDVKNEFIEEAPRDAPAKVVIEAGPVVDESLAQAKASYLKPVPAIKVTEEAFIPAEVFEDAKIVVGDIERELEATSIPVESFPAVNNDFKVRPTSNMTPAVEPIAVCPSCATENCAGCQVDEVQRGEPMFENNDFAEPEGPGGVFVPPMTIVPAEVPVVSPTPFNAASSEFGGTVNLEAPPETDSVIAHVASLPVTGNGPPVVVNSKVPPVGVSALMELNAVTWKSRLDEAIELAEERLNRINNPADSTVVNLRLLKALRGQMEHMDASTASGQLTENESQYWQHQLEAITAMLGSPAGANQAITDYHRHQTAHKTLEHLRNAVSQLESIASLKVGSGQFCTEITGFGQFRTFASNAFTAGQKMLVYCEVENYRTIENQSATGADFRTRLKGSFAIYDADGKVVQQAEYPTVDDVARKRRRDFYMYLPVTLSDLPSGQYVLHALVEDIHGNKTASLDPPLNFSVK